MSSLNRLIKLARRTGDRLIVHDPAENNDIVIMDVNEYEMLLNDEQDVRALSERQLLDKINRDIAIWRANDKLENEQIMEEWESEENAMDSDFRNFNQPAEWHSASSILNDRNFGEYATDMEIEKKPSEEVTAEDIPDFESVVESKNIGVEAPEISLEPIMENKNEEQEKKVSADDEPMFYEEPV